jgi:hypothetical protein
VAERLSMEDSSPKFKHRRVDHDKLSEKFAFAKRFFVHCRMKVGSEFILALSAFADAEASTYRRQCSTTPIRSECRYYCRYADVFVTEFTFFLESCDDFASDLNKH